MGGPNGPEGTTVRAPYPEAGTDLVQITFIATGIVALEEVTSVTSTTRF